MARDKLTEWFSSREGLSCRNVRTLIDNQYEKIEWYLECRLKRAFKAGQKAESDHKQAIIDRLMLEYCPEEMTEEQLEEWKKHHVDDDLNID